MIRGAGPPQQSAAVFPGWVPVTIATARTDASFTRPRHAGVGDLKLPRRLHSVRRRTSYSEIGIAVGKTLARAAPASRSTRASASCAMRGRARRPAICSRGRAMPSSSRTIRAGCRRPRLHRRHVSLRFARRDVMKIEPHCRPDSLIVLHDCLPTRLCGGFRHPSGDG